MVSANLERIGNEFDDMVAERDWMGYIALAGVGALGGVGAELLQDRLAPRLNQPTEPTGARGLAASFGMKSLAAIVLGFAALQASGSLGNFLAVAGVGAAIDAGVDLLEIGDQFRGSGVVNQPMPSRSAQQAQPPQQAQQAQPAQAPPSAGRSAAPTGNSSLLNQV